MVPICGNSFASLSSNSSNHYEKAFYFCIALAYFAFPGHGQVVSNHSVSATIVGLEYGYEQRLADQWSLIGRAGLSPVVTILDVSPANFDAHFVMGPSVTVEPRLYTSMKRRLNLGRDTHNNASAFVSLRLMTTWLSQSPLFSVRPAPAGRPFFFCRAPFRQPSGHRMRVWLLEAILWPNFGRIRQFCCHRMAVAGAITILCPMPSPAWPGNDTSDRDSGPVVIA